ncbi:MAG: ASCH domain-containing protein [Treponema sp.]|jgi:hypothetical protein|nr:ASCH domain-containing protein [Treponema sp.]
MARKREGIVEYAAPRNVPMKVLSVRQPYAALICAGVKKVENRTWTTAYRGRLLIHASGKALEFYDFKGMPTGWRGLFAAYAGKYGFLEVPDGAPESIRAAWRLNRLIFKHYHIDKGDKGDTAGRIKEAAKRYGCFFAARAIIGEAVLAGIVRNSGHDFAEPGQYHWIMADPVLYDKPILNVSGRLRLWDFHDPSKSTASASPAPHGRGRPSDMNPWTS